MSKLVLCACKRGNKISKDKVLKWKDNLDKQKIAYTLIDDLCGLAAKGEINFEDISNGEESVFIACQPKAVKNLLKRAGIEVKDSKFDFYNAETNSTDILDEKQLDKGEITEIAYNEDWKPWYPVLDYDLCTSCQKCLNFCLFGVYTMNNEGKVIVENPENCKDLCPACARTCPTTAIVFPKHHESPIDGGDGEMKDDNSSLLSQIQKTEDVYKLLENRRKASGVSLFNVDQLKIAEQERDKYKNDENKKK